MSAYSGKKNDLCKLLSKTEIENNVRKKSILFRSPS
jgi:hypothetical protein